VTSVVVAALALWLGSGAEPSRKQYLVHVSSVCTAYARRLERVPAPSDPAAYGNVISSLQQVVPLLRAQERAMRAIPPPRSLQLTVGRLFAVDRTSIAALDAALAAAKRRDAGGVASDLARFSSVRDRVHSLAVALGIRCTPN
jgi:hypothetical protein